MHALQSVPHAYQLHLWRLLLKPHRCVFRCRLSGAETLSSLEHFSLHSEQIPASILGGINEKNKYFQRSAGRVLVAPSKASTLRLPTFSRLQWEHLPNESSRGTIALIWRTQPPLRIVCFYWITPSLPTVLANKPSHCFPEFCFLVARRTWQVALIIGGYLFIYRRKNSAEYNTITKTPHWWVSGILE